MNGEEEKALLAQLEQEIDTDDTATVEQYVSMPFNDRLLTLLEKQPPTTIVTALNEVRSSEFTPDNTTSEEHAPEGISFRVQGTAQFDTEVIEMDAVIQPDTPEGWPFHITNSPTNKDEFIVNIQNDEGIFIQTLSKEELFVLFATLVDQDGPALLQIRDSLPEEMRSTPKYLHDLIEQFWMELGEQSGRKVTIRTLEKDVSQASELYKEYVRLTYEEEETFNDSLIHLTLENVKEFNDLDARDLHRLHICLSTRDVTRFDQDAQRQIRSGNIQPITTDSNIDQTSGRTTSLDLNDPIVVRQFVQWFNQLIA